MDPTIQSLLNRLENLSEQFRELRDGVQEVVEIADLSPSMALTRARKVLEYVVRDVFERRVGESPKTKPLENLLHRLFSEGYLPRELDTYVYTVRTLGNDGTHKFGDTFQVTEVYRSLTNLMPILEWYFEVERPEALDGQAARMTPIRPAENRPTAKTIPATTHITIVPKGLRSFDANDANFFLNLLPGARDDLGLPESIRFWKHRIESSDETFAVGIIYGPSGCGKTSFVKAGLLPRLMDEVIAVYIEATADDTESRLLKGLRKQCPALSDELGLVETITALRQGQQLPEGKRVLIVIDQFEQWLHAHQGEQDTDLAKALRQCDGEHVQAIVLVRDDFGLALYRFMGDLHIEVLQGKNMAVVDLFDPIHARNVLTAFGRAYGRLNETTAKDQDAFLDKAIQGLAHDGRIICVQLSLFAQMVKGKHWTPATLNELGGMEGVGVNFLEETFSSRTANPQHRLHENAARGVLKALLPESGSDIKGNMRSHDELLAASGFQGSPADFTALLGILDTELRLITPTDPKKLQSESASDPGSKYFQLTHDYLVPSLREWLTRKQKETRRGRAELRLADRASMWKDKPENRHLPSLLEYLNIGLLTNRKDWTESQRGMMKKARRVHGLHSALAAVVLVLLVIGGREIYGRNRANSLEEQLAKADIAEVPSIVKSLGPYRSWANPLLHQEEDRAREGSPQKLRLALALLPVDAGQIDYLRDQLLVVTPTEFPFVRDALLTHQDAITEPLWTVALDSQLPTERRFQAACALATYAPKDNRWQEVGAFVAGYLVSRQASEFLAWREALRPAKEQLIKPLSVIYRDTAQKEQPRLYATETLADYASMMPEVLFDLLADAEQFQFQIVFSKSAVLKERATTLARQEVTRKPAGDASEEDKEALAKRHANAAIALYRMGDYEKVWPLLKFSPDPRVRSYIIHWLSKLGGDPKPIIERFEAEPDVTIRRALVLALGEFNDTQLPIARRQTLAEKLLPVYGNEPDAGLHGALEWLLRQWDQGDKLQAVVDKNKVSEERLQAGKADEKKNWYINTQGQTFVIVDAHEPFSMGSPDSELRRISVERQHLLSLGRRFAISASEVTKTQFARFQEAETGVAKVNTDAWVKTDDSPQTAITWYEAAWYCNWLSKTEGIPEDQWSYKPNGEGKYGPGMKAKEKFWELQGYRLPTEAEWEYACRGGTVTSRYYGLTETLLPKYAWYEANSENRVWPVAGLKPNDLGLFGMLGNAFEWCFDEYQEYPNDAGKVVEDSPSTTPLEATESRVLRGGAFGYLPEYVRSAFRTNYQPGFRANFFGFRPARTYP